MLEISQRKRIKEQNKIKKSNGYPMLCCNYFEYFSYQKNKGQLHFIGLNSLLKSIHIIRKHSFDYNNWFYIWIRFRDIDLFWIFRFIQEFIINVMLFICIF